jgi:hypothetical protein
VPLASSIGTAMPTTEPIPLWRRDNRRALFVAMVGAALLLMALLQWLRGRRLRAASSAWTDSAPADAAPDTTPST